MARLIKVSGPSPKSGPKLVEDIKDGIMRTLQKRTASRHIARRSLITATWKGNTPQFGVHVSKTSTGVLFQVMLTGGISEDRLDGNSKWVWLNDGTDVRYATMSKDFKAKTARGREESTAGAGRFLFVNRKVPREGIEKRKFDEDIGDRDRPELLNDIGGGILDGFLK